MWLGIRVERAEFHEFSDWLRVHGVIENGPQDIGEHHTLNISKDDDLTIQKVWSRPQLDILEQAERSTERPLITLVAIDEDEATVAQLREYGIKKLAIVQSGRTGKYAPSGKDRSAQFYEEVLGTIAASGDPGPLVIVGPGFAKEGLAAHGRQSRPELFRNCQVVPSGQSGMAAVQEVLRKGIGSKLLEESRVGLETRLVERLLEEIGKEGLYAYGREEVARAAESGAVETLLLTTCAVRSRTHETSMEAAKSSGGDVVVISEVHDAGKKLEALGGIGAILRYRLR
jgi:protein pelota